MRIKVHFFAQLRDVVQNDIAEVEVPDDATIRDLAAHLSEMFPRLREHLNVTTFAVNDDYVQRERRLDDGDSVALIPPISGG